MTGPDRSGRRFFHRILATVWVSVWLFALPASTSAQNGAGTNQQSTAKAHANWFARHPVVVGTLIGAGTGAALSSVDAIGGANHDPAVILIGAGAGAWGGLVASAVQKSRAKQRVGRGTKIGIFAGAVALVVVPVVACYGAGGCGGSS